MKTVSVLCVGAAMMIGAMGSALADATSQTEGLAFEAIAQGNWTAAEAELRAGLAQTPTDPMKLLNLAYVLQKSGRSDEAAGIHDPSWLQTIRHTNRIIVNQFKCRPRCNITVWTDTNGNTRHTF